MIKSSMEYSIAYTTV